VRVNGIQSCDTCRKARNWLDGHGIEYEWIDLRERPPTRADVEKWLAVLGAEALVNRRSKTWRELPEHQRPGLDSPALIDTLVAHPTLIKRPLFERSGNARDAYRVGFGEAQRQWLQQA